jgi:hypothetical protein
MMELDYEEVAKLNSYDGTGLWRGGQIKLPQTSAISLSLYIKAENSQYSQLISRERFYPHLIWISLQKLLRIYINQISCPDLIH